MQNIHLEKKGLRGLAIAESFKQSDPFSKLAGVVIRRDLVVDGFVFSKCNVEGDDATDAILDMYQRLERNDISYLMISGLIIAMYNMIDISRIWEQIKIPVIAITYQQSGGLENAIKHHFPNSYQNKLKQYNKIGKRTEFLLHTGHKIYLRFEGCPSNEVKLFVDNLTLQGSVPEPLRVAKLLAKRYPIS